MGGACLHGEGTERRVGFGSSPLKTILLVHPVLHPAYTHGDGQVGWSNYRINALSYDTGNILGSQREKRSNLPEPFHLETEAFQTTRPKSLHHVTRKSPVART